MQMKRRLTSRALNRGWIFGETVMTYKEALNIFDISDILDLPSAIMRVVMSPTDYRDKIYRRLLEVENFDLSHDWFQELFEAEMSEGKRKGQHFTPNEIYSLLPKIVGDSKTCHEPTAGNGGLIIGKWYQDISQKFPWEYRPSEHTVVAVELSERSIPFLLLNLSIRGIMGYVYHGDVLENKFKTRYILLNGSDDSLGFSDVVEDKDFNKKIVKI